MARVIAISGGIGVGKSIICKVLLHLGYAIYDCDSMAKEIMNNSQSIKDYIATNISMDAICNNTINRKVLANIVFNNNVLLNKLNSIVHYEVKNDIVKWTNHYYDNNIVFIETAILYQSGIDQLVDEVWEISASDEIRIARVMKRNNLSREDVIARINSQKMPSKDRIHKVIHQITNDNNQAILPQILQLLK